MPDDQHEPDTLRDTVPIRPLKPWLSRLLVTCAIVAAAALGVLAARMMLNMASDPNVQARYEAVERMRRGETAADTAARARPDTLDGTASDSTR